MPNPISRLCFRMDRLDLFWRFVCERQTVWHRRFVERLPPPWTRDVVIQRERFTNVYRELDPGTQYALTAILEQPAPKADKIFNIMLYRLIGRAETHAALSFQELAHFNAAQLEQKLKNLRDVKGKTLFTAAYMVSAYTKMGSHDKVENVARLFDKLHQNFLSFYKQIEACSCAAEVYAVLRSADGFGNFLAYQVLVDLLYPLKVLNNTPLLPYSHDDWSSAGPGAIRGISILIKEEVKARHLDIMRWLHGNQDSEFHRLGLTFPYLTNNSGQVIVISLANIQNCLCEFHKYVKIGNGTGKGRRKFYQALKDTCPSSSQSTETLT